MAQIELVLCRRSQPRTEQNRGGYNYGKTDKLRVNLDSDLKKTTSTTKRKTRPDQEPSSYARVSNADREWARAYMTRQSPVFFKHTNPNHYLITGKRAHRAYNFQRRELPTHCVKKFISRLSTRLSKKDLSLFFLWHSTTRGWSRLNLKEKKALGFMKWPSATSWKTARSII